MDANDHEKILSYFIEEAKEHLTTLEQGILDLSSVVGNAERVNEMFRAAHSIKGGAAMLALSSIQKTAHRLEDGFKFLQEHKINVDQKLESLFFGLYDVLQNLIERLQRSPFRLTENEAKAILKEAEPTFAELQNYLNQLLGGSTPRSSAEAVPPAKDSLKQMLQLFQGEDTPASRQQLQQLCDRLAELALQEPGWQLLLKTAKMAIANPKHSYNILAPVVIKELKQGSDYLELGQVEQILPSPSLQQLAGSKLPQILVTVEPQAVAAALRQVFNQQQLSQLVQLLNK